MDKTPAENTLSQPSLHLLEHLLTEGKSVWQGGGGSSIFMTTTPLKIHIPALPCMPPPCPSHSVLATLLGGSKQAFEHHGFSLAVFSKGDLIH